MAEASAVGPARSAVPAVVVIVFSIFFVRRFLTVPEHSRNVDRVLLGVAAVTVVLYLANLIGLHFALTPVMASIGLVVTVVYAAMGLAAARRRYRPARFFLIAFATLLTGNVVYMLTFLRVLPTTFLTYNAAQAGSAIECILLAFALADWITFSSTSMMRNRSSTRTTFRNSYSDAPLS